MAYVRLDEYKKTPERVFFIMLVDTIVTGWNRIKQELIDMTRYVELVGIDNGGLVKQQ